MDQKLLEKFADKCEQLCEEKETEREWLSDYANMVLEEAAKRCETVAVSYTSQRWRVAADDCVAAIRALKAPNVELTGDGRVYRPASE